MTTSDLKTIRNSKNSSCGFIYRFDSLSRICFLTDFYYLIFIAFWPHVRSAFTVSQSVGCLKFFVHPN